ncbi:MAG: hypothetical protein M5U27_12610 [Gaiella sp.]|nr:hypothetical protein [Gaiella sp.]
MLRPQLAATTAFLLARRITGRFAPSLVGGYLFGFSSYELGRMLGHLPLAFIALVPLVPYLVLLRRDDALSRRRFVLLLAGILVCQFLILPQIFFTVVVMGAVTAVAATALLGRRAVRQTVAEAAVALALAAIVVSPVLAYAVVSDAAPPARSPFAGSADVLNYFVPTGRTWLRPPGADAIAQRFTGSGAEHGAYLGLPLIALVALGAFRRPISRGRWLLIVALSAGVILSLGTRIKLAGEVVGIGPWAALAPLPVVGSARQSEAGFSFRLVGGHFGLRVTPAEERWRDVYEALGTGRVSPERLRSFFAAHDVDAVVVAPGTRAAVHRTIAAAVGSRPAHPLDVLVYRLGKPSPSVPRPADEPAAGTARAPGEPPRRERPAARDGALSSRS